MGADQDEIALVQRYIIPVKLEDFQVWDLKVAAAQSAVFICCDGNGREVYSKSIPFTASRYNRSLLYQRVPRLFEALALARDYESHARLIRADLLILDDWGLQPLDATARHGLLEILEDRYERRSTVITSKLPLDRWRAVIGDPTYADAIMDSRIHNADRFELSRESLRKI